MPVAPIDPPLPGNPPLLGASLTPGHAPERSTPAPRGESRPDVLVMGESLVDVVHRPDAVDRHPGGSPMNVAVGLSRLRHRVRLATHVGDDADGALIRDHLAASGVRLEPGSIQPGPTSTAMAVIDGTGAASYEFTLRWSPSSVDLTGAGHLHVGSIAAHLMPGATTVLALVDAARGLGITTSYDPNLRPTMLGPADRERPRVEELVRRTDVVKVSDEDLTWLYPDADPHTSAARWADLGPALVVLTRGADGATAWISTGASGRPTQPLVLPALRVTVVDTVGAGDAFMSGLLSGLMDAGLLGGSETAAPSEARQALREAGVADVRPALDRALLTSAITCSRPGADPPTRADLLAAL